MGWKRSPDRLKQAGAKRLSPLSWSRLKPGRNKQDSPGKVAPAAFFGDTPGGDLGDSDGCNKEENLNHNDNKRPIPSDDLPNACVDGPAMDDETKSKDIHTGCTEATTLADGGVASGGRNMQGPDPEPDESRHDGAGGDRKGEQGLTTEEKVTGDLHQEDTAVSSKWLETGARQPPATAAAGPPEAAKHARRVLARDNTLTSRDEWPELLDSEPDPELWALDKGEDDVLAAAKSMGSVLVRVVTWNLHAKPTPAADKLRETILPPGKFHIYAIGTEECLHSIAKSVIVHSKKEWESLLKETLGYSYEMLCAHGLQATHNAVFAHRGIIPLLRNVRSSAVATGLSLGAPSTTLGNKGGVGISFSVGATSCVFVNSHLAAHQNNVRERNDHFFQISNGLVRDLGPPGPSGVNAGAAHDGRDPKCEEEPPPAAASAPLSVSEQSPPGEVGWDERANKRDDDDGGDDGGGANAEGQPPPVSVADATAGVRGQGPGEESTTTRPSMVGARSLDGDGDPDHSNLNSAAMPAECSKVAASPLSPTGKEGTRSKETKTDVAAVAAAAPKTVVEEVDGAVDKCTTPPLTPDPSDTRPSRRSTGQQDESGGNHGGRQWRGQEEAQPGVGLGGRDMVPKHSSDARSSCTTLPQAFDRVFWAGDLNYRVNAPRAVADLLLSKDMHGVLLNNEQLSLERSRDRGGEGGGEGGRQAPPFSGYSEGPLNFRPTYKFDSGTDTYDTSSKQRVPAWTDRILYSGRVVSAPPTDDAAATTVKKNEPREMCNEGKSGEENGVGGVGAMGGIQLTAYRSVGELKTSDHRPVLASFVMQFDQQEGGHHGNGGAEEAAVTNQTSSEVCAVM
ncbi:Endonuclease/Exonuclease/phosphatase family protein [Ectocarpus siliculosus]|uniref:Endonuclease/Exonuclease/phosphatase family protein n=1 Tax=Ectocarpus siliculosus TaxID=2880 RepID=D8LBI7_ECTSI|nr:Endonuclease/Exonuclease/phosphatase family protein [Ectocarpus siliculosus]|eukprot:CBN76696.1 Endonuclease/Exonuclease/phosphatase family protein [Ectocarpus siliculosus]